MEQNTLVHHGIKGQKWGKQNGPPYPIPYRDHSRSEKKANWQYSLAGNTNERSLLKKTSDNTTQYGKLTFRKHTSSQNNKSKASSKTTGPLRERFESPFKKAGIMASNGIHTSDINARKLFTTRSLNDKGIEIKKGAVVQHVMSTPTKDLTDRDYLFVAATEADKKNYGGFFAALTKYRNDVDTMYKMEITAAHDLISPSKKERVDTFMKIYNEDPVRVAKQLAEFNKRNYAGQYKETVDELVDKYSNMSTRQLKKMGYYTYANSWFDPEAGTLKDMRAELEKKGYNAIIDDNDKRSFVNSEAPLIVFDIMENFGDMKVSELSQQEIRRNMLDWQNMKHSDLEEGAGIMNNFSVELYHHGIKGQRWGVRRYQNKDGTLTELGKARWRDEILDNKGKKKDNRIDTSEANPHRWDIEDTQKQINLLANTTKISDKSLNLMDSIEDAQYQVRKAHRPKVDLSEMTDQELRDAINRTRLEDQYVDVVLNRPEDISRGKAYAKGALKVAGSAIAVGASALEIALLIKQLRGPRIPVVL